MKTLLCVTNESGYTSSYTNRTYSIVGILPGSDHEIGPGFFVSAFRRVHSNNANYI
jgi:hypothetical protein